MPSTTRYLSQEVIDALRREIAEAGGNELFAILTKAEDDAVFTRMAVVARGTETEVLALISRVNPGDMTVHNHPSGVLRPSEPDMNMAHLFGETGAGSMIVDNEVADCYVVVEAAEPVHRTAVEEELVTRLFADDGPLALALEHYESRPGQVAMARAVAAALNGREITAIEAGTGTGKSLAYLLPALLWTKQNRERVVIATKTIALQEQLVYKDIPLARKILPDAPRAELVKGRGNYVCLRKLNDVRSNQMSLFTEGERDLEKEIEELAVWMENDGSGDRADLPFLPSKDAWDMVRSDADMCLGSKCPFFQRAPFYDSRRRAAQARILVVNQALLFADLALRSSSGNYQTAAVIPPYKHVILDEAHSIEDIATDHFGDKVSSFGLRLTLGKIYNTGRGSKGLLHRLLTACGTHGAPGFFQELEGQLMRGFTEQQMAVINQLYALSAELHGELNPQGNRQSVIWIRESLLASGRLSEARIQAKALLRLIHELVMALRRIRLLWKDQSDAFLEKTNGMLIELEARMSRLDSVMTALKSFAIDPGENQVPWLELRKMRNHDEFEYKVSPLDVSGTLREALYKPFESVVMTSATLNLNDDFAFFLTRNGLKDWDERVCRHETFPSPFDYRAQARLLLAKLPSAPNGAGYIDDLVDVILRAALSGDPGGTLALFTSYSMLTRTARALEVPLGRAGVTLLVQGRAPRSQLVAQQLRSRGVLLGTDSFWEGVDLPGEALTKLIITKLPFRQVGDPIFEARCAAIDRGGGSSFAALSLPLAMLKLKQGAGRLIRTRTDRGVLIVTDNRIRSKGYGKRFLSLLKGYPLVDLNGDEVAEALRPKGVGY